MADHRLKIDTVTRKLEPYWLTCNYADNTPRQRPGERLHHLFEQRVDTLARASMTTHLAVDGDDQKLTYADLDSRANQLAHSLIARGCKPGDIVALLLDKSAAAYIAMLAVQKAHAAYVPLDPAFPPERVAFIVEDAGASMLLSLSAFADRCTESSLTPIYLDREADAIAAQSPERPQLPSVGQPALAYIIYTSGTTGQPKGVPIEQDSVCNFIRVAAEVYGFATTDRVYQGLTIAFDFAVEEIWVPLAVGATLLPCGGERSLVGQELGDFLQHKRATALCCVPTLLSTLDGDFPHLQLLLVSGEACPPDLIRRWDSPNRTILNAYGPTEATVTTTLALPTADDAEHIGRPLPTYSVVVLDPNAPRALAQGQSGELAVGGIGVASGYLNRPEQSNNAFIPDFIGLPHNPGGQLYRTGDLCYIDARGRVVYQGRIDAQVKISGYRIELGEIESQLLTLPGVAQAVVEPFALPSGQKKLIAYLSAERGQTLDTRATLAELRQCLPSYMVPAQAMVLDALPMLASDKVDRRALPPPSLTTSTPHEQYSAPNNPQQTIIAEVLAHTIGCDCVSVEADFFTELGMDSLTLAQFCAALRQRLPKSAVAMRDAYTHSSVQSLDTHLNDDSASKRWHSPVDNTPPRAPKRREYLLTGTLQALATVVLCALVGHGLHTLFTWLTADERLIDPFRAGIVAAVVLGALLGLPIALKWLLIGRWRTGKTPIWGCGYFRFWLVRAALAQSPITACRGTPLFNAYLRLLGAKIGRGAVLELKTIPLCTDLLTVSDGAIIRDEAHLFTYKAHNGYLWRGPIHIGAGASVGYGSSLDIHTHLGDGAQLAHASAVAEGQQLPAGESWHGIPARPCDGKPPKAPRAASPPRWRLALYATSQLLGLYLPIALVALLLKPALYTFTQWQSVGPWSAVSSTPLYVASLLAALVIATTVIGLIWRAAKATLLPRMLRPLLPTGKRFPLFGLRHAAYRSAKRASSAHHLNRVFGDSSFVLNWLRALGYHFDRPIQTGSNFGLEQYHSLPWLCHIGYGSMVSDGLRLVNSEENAKGVRLFKTQLPANSFVGNDVFLPHDHCLGDNCLLATKVMVPNTGPTRHDTGLLGSPPFEIPRCNDEDIPVATATTNEDRERALGAKNHHNLLTAIAFVSAGAGEIWLLLMLVYVSGAWRMDDPWRIAIVFLLAAPVTAAWWALVQRLAYRFKKVPDLHISIYDRHFWEVERMWKLTSTRLGRMFVGTPWRSLLLRAQGIRVGSMVFDDGCYFSEHTMVSIGDHCNLNREALIQCHSLEDGVFKSATTTIGDSISIEPKVLVHYGVHVDTGARICTDAFLMKGETVAVNEHWAGNPARPL